MTEHHFDTPHPISLYIEIGKGSVQVVADDVAESHVEVRGRDADQVRVERSGDEISVVAPRQRTGFLSGDAALDVLATIPTRSDIAIRTGSADVTVSGTVGAGHLKSGSGDVLLESLDNSSTVETGSGDVRVEEARAELRIKSGSGDITLGHVAAATAVSTGSGDVEIAVSDGPTVVKTGSGDLRVVEASSDVSMTTGSGDLVVDTANRGRFSAKGASSDIRIGIPAGVPVWTDVSTVTGQIHSNLTGAGEPEAGADHVELRAKTVSGDIILTEL